MNNYMDLAQSPVLWLLAFSVMSVIVFQAIRFYRLAKLNAEEGYATRAEMKTAMKVGAIASFGPSVAVAIVALSLIPIFGTPVTLMRIGMIGSVQYEVAAATAASESLGVPLGGEGFTDVAFALVFFTMALGAAVWMLQVLLFTPSMGKLQKRISEWRPWVMTAVTGGALIGAFGYLTMNQAPGGVINIVVMTAAGLSMALLQILANKYKKSWLKEWSLGIAMLMGLFSAAILL